MLGQTLWPLIPRKPTTKEVNKLAWIGPLTSQVPGKLSEDERGSKKAKQTVVCMKSVIQKSTDDKSISNSISK